MKPLVFQHYAANGRTVTACGLKIEPNSDANERQHSNGHSSWTHAGGEPKCRKCRAVLASTKVADLVRCSEDDSDTALERATAAMQAAGALCKRLGTGWWPRVWYNCGWHCEVIYRQLHVGDYGPYFRAHFEPGSFWGEDTTPLKAVRATLRLIEAERDRLDEMAGAARASIA